MMHHRGIHPAHVKSVKHTGLVSFGHWIYLFVSLRLSHVIEDHVVRQFMRNSLGGDCAVRSLSPPPLFLSHNVDLKAIKYFPSCSVPVSREKSTPLKHRREADSGKYETSPPSMGVTFRTYKNPPPRRCFR